MSIELEPLTAVIGAEVRGVDVSSPLDDETVAEIRKALLAHEVLVFRDQDLDSEVQIAFARHFGEIKPPPVSTRHGGPPEVNVIDQTTPRGEGADNWHADNTYTETPPMGSVLRVVQLPPAGGDTAIASMYAAYEALSPPIRALCDELTAVHDVTRSLSKAIARGHSSADLAEMRKKLPPVEHPVVIVHPETGRRALFVNGNSTTRIVGVSEAESDMLLRFLFDHVKQPEFHVRIKWDTRTLVFFDNRCTQHYAIADYSERRILHRVAVAGERPLGIADAKAA
ncbi:MAG: TauD/TfdA family dioxygenase [Deltaproteobacteria bacterium]|jgi:taurine dioxygenase|nr:TauD/TfdA family dioxygenase [Deltaproteobacteria bacterium]